MINPKELLLTINVGIALYSKTAKKDASASPWDTSKASTINVSTEPDPWA